MDSKKFDIKREMTNRLKELKKIAVLCTLVCTLTACNNSHIYEEVIDTAAIEAVVVNYDGLLSDMIDIVNEELPIAFGEYIACIKFDIDEDNLNIYYLVNEDHLSMSMAIQNMQQNRKMMLPMLFVDSDRLTSEDKKDIEELYGVDGNFTSTNGLIVHCLYETDRGVSIQLIGSDEEEAYEVITYSPHELHRVYKD